MNDADIQELFAPAAARSLPPVAFSLDDVVRQGTSVRRRRRAASVTTILAVVVLVVGGFAVLSSGKDNSPAAPVPTSAEQLAGRAVAYALAITPIPSNAHAVLPVPGVTPDTPTPIGPTVQRTAWYAVAAEPSVVADWVTQHAFAAGWDSSTESDDTSAGVDLTWAGRADPQVQNVATPAPAVELTVVRRDGGSVIRVDGWQRPQPMVARDPSTMIGQASAVQVVPGPQVATSYTSVLSLTLQG